MSDRGYFAVSRAVFDHAVFAPEPFTEREAWLWMIGSAAWKAKTVRVGRHAVQLERGQLSFSTRFLATKWRWSESRVRRYLKRLENATMICVKIDAEATHRATHITICNYDEYQSQRRSGDDEIDAEATHKRRKEEPLNHLTNNQKEDTRASRAVGPREKSPREELETVLDRPHAEAVVEHRKRLRKPLTPHAARLLARKFATAPDPNLAADTMIANGWQGFELHWLENRSRGHGPPGKRTYVDALVARLSEKNHAETGLSGNSNIVELLPAAGGKS